MLVSTYEKQNNEKQLYAQEIDKSGKFIGQKRLIDKYETNKKKRAHYSEWFSDDRSKFMTILHPDEDKKASEKFFIKVYDSELNNLLNTQVTLPYEDENVGVEDYYLTNDGLVVMLVEIDKEAKETSKTDDDKKYELLVLDQKGTLNKFNIAISKKSIQSIGVRINDKEGKIICSGLYADITSSANNRITSYNVCYTKLLRITRWKGSVRWSVPSTRSTSASIRSCRSRVSCAPCSIRA